MSLFQYPDRLGDLAAEALRKTVSDALALMVRVHNDTVSAEDIRSQYVRPICKYLSELMESTLLPNMVNQVTNKLLNFVGIACKSLYLKQYYESCSFPMVRPRGYEDSLILLYYNRRRTWRMEVAKEILNTVFCPSVTAIKLPQRHGAFCELSDEEFLYMYLFSVPPDKFRNVIVLDLGQYFFCEEDLLNVLSEMNSLEEYSYIHCTNRMLKVLLNSCPKLRILNINCSGTSICDDSVDLIVKFKCLEKLHINFTFLELSKLLEAYTQYEVLDTGECPRNPTKVLMDTIEGWMSLSGLKLLPDSFPNLKCLILHLEFCEKRGQFDKTSLQRMTKLTNLTIYQRHCAMGHRQFSYHNTCNLPLEDLFQVIGRQLVELHLTEMNGVDIRMLAENCPYLRRLEIALMKEDSLLQFSQKFPIPAIKSVTFLNIRIQVVGCDVIFTKCDSLESKSTSYSVAVDRLEENEKEVYAFVTAGVKFPEAWEEEKVRVW